MAMTGTASRLRKGTAGLLGALLLAASLTGVAAPDPQEAQDLLERKTAEALEIVRQEAEDGEIDVEALRERLSDIIMPHLDFVTMTKLAVGRHWRDASDDQKRALVREFRKLLVRTYTQSLDEYDGQELEFLPLRPSPHEDRVTVRSRVTQSNGPEIPVHYSLRHHDGAWRVYDISVDGVSLVTTYRSSFSSQIQDNGIAGLIEALEQKNAAGDTGPAPS